MSFLLRATSFEITILLFVNSNRFVQSLGQDNHKEKWIWIFGFVAVLFNPFFPIYLNRELWTIIDLATGLFLIASIFVLKFARKP